jgi:hypothetical protein
MFLDDADQQPARPAAQWIAAGEVPQLLSFPVYPKL